MAEETNYGDEIVSSEEEEMDEEGAQSNSEASEAEDEEEGEKDEMDEHDEGESMDTMDRDGGSVAESNNKIIAMDTMATPSSPVNNASDKEDESIKSNDDEDKESSYRSSPPESPSSPPPQPQSRSRSVSPDRQSAIRDAADSVNNISKGNIDEREGELDFEEDTAEDVKDETVGNVELTDKEEKQSKNDVAKTNVDENAEAADADDDGEVEDDDDLEEGEVKDSSSNRKLPQRPMCRFFSKGQCTWGNNCRFLHPGINDKGNYNMFAPVKASANNGSNSLYSWHAGGSRPDAFYNKGFSDTVLPPPIIPPPPPAIDEPHRESAWERGLRHAKEILKKSSQRKEIDPDFEEKRLNLSLSSSEVYNDFEKENDYYNRGSPYRRNSDRYSYEYEDPLLDPYDRQAHEYWRGGNYENFEVRYMRSDYDYRDEREGERMRESERNRLERVREREVYHVEREREGRSRRDKFERQHSPERSWRDEHYNEMPPQNRNRGDEWRDPWRRSTSPKRVDQRRSYSSNSSASYSSSRSSASHSSYTSASRSSSASSHSSYSSRSYSRSRMHVKPQMQHKMYADQEIPNRRVKIPPSSGNSALQAKMPRHQDKWNSSGSVPAPMQITKTNSPSAIPSMDKKKIKANIPSRQMMREGSLSSTGSSRSSHSVSSHTSSSRSRSRGSSASDLESVSSKSSISSKSSYGGGSQVKPQAAAGFKRDDRHLKDKRKVNESGKSVEKSQQQNVSRSAVSGGGSTAKVLTKDLLKHSGQKTQIKLTLLNKERAAAANAAAISQSTMHRKDMGDVKKMKVLEKETVKVTKPAATNPPQSRKRAGSPLHAPAPEVPSVSAVKNSKIPQTSTNPASSKSSSVAISAISKKSTSSRREELLKQLKAVEDAIARKRAKLS